MSIMKLITMISADVIVKGIMNKNAVFTGIIWKRVFEYLISVGLSYHLVEIPLNNMEEVF